MASSHQLVQKPDSHMKKLHMGVREEPLAREPPQIVLRGAEMS